MLHSFINNVESRELIVSPAGFIYFDAGKIECEKHPLLERIFPLNA